MDTRYRDRDWLAEQVSQGHGCASISAQCGVTEATVRDWALHFELPIKVPKARRRTFPDPPRPDWIDEKTLRKYAELELPAYSIAKLAEKEAGRRITRWAVYKAMRQLRIPYSPPWIMDGQAKAATKLAGRRHYNRGLTAPMAKTLYGKAARWWK